MRDKNLLQLFLILNVALAGCFVVYLLLSSNGQPKVMSMAFPAASIKSNTPLSGLKPSPASLTNLSIPTSNELATASSLTNAPGTNEVAGAPKAVFSQKKFNWEQVESDSYKTYLESLRAVGCPEDKVRNIIMADINELFDKRRVTEAKALDPQWWKARPDLMIANALQEKGRALEEQRRALVEKLLGVEVAQNEKSEAMLWSNVQLTGEVLGSLPSELHNAVQEICGRSIERTQGAFWARINDGQQPNPIDMAKLRDQTRVDLRKILSPDAMEEFLLRYSHNAEQLRTELSGLNPSPEEFRKVFRAIDPLDHQLQMEFGGPESLSQQQRERHERQRDAAIKEAFGPKRYQEYLATKDPAYRQAQLTARQYGAPDKAIQPIYEMAKASEEKRRKILSDAGMTAEQKSAALNAVNIEQIQMVQRIVSEAASRR